MKRLAPLLVCIAAAACASAGDEPVAAGGGWTVYAPAAQTSAVPGLAAFVDPPRHPTHPARNRQLLISSHGKEMNALFLLAAGEGPKPTMLLLHGLPGNERNFDLAQAVRRAGWNVLTFSYRGAWGSQGIFSIQHAIDDARAAMAFLRTPQAVHDYGIDADRLVVAGHSMGGFAAAATAAADPGLAGLILLDAWDIGDTAAQVREAGAAGREAFIASFDDLGHALGPITAADLADELARRGENWQLDRLAPSLSGKAILTIYATHGIAAENRAFADSLRQGPNARVTAVEMDTDHAFADHRIALALEVVRWLQTLER